MAELQSGKYEFYPYECSRCKEPTLQDLEALLKSLKDEKRETVRTKAKQSQRRSRNVPPADNRVV
jgi:hypothetical protein